MLCKTYPFELPPLPYAYDALEPYIDKETLHYHHDKHFQNYINELNKALQPYPALQDLTLEQILADPASLPRDAYTDIMHNGGGTYNHYIYFEGLAPASQGTHIPHGELLTSINNDYSSFENFKKVFSKEAIEVFGSGWTCLALTPQKLLTIINLKNQDTALPYKYKPLILVDVWEHAYYLKYKNLRAEYVNNVWNLLSF